MGRITRAGAVVAGLAVAVPLALAGCGRDEPAPAAVAAPASATPSPGASPEPSPAGPFSFAITPRAGAKNLPVSAEVGIALTGGTVSAVTLTDNRGEAVGGDLREDGTAWVPARPLRYGRSYTARVTVTQAGGGAETRTTTFSTVRSRPGREVSRQADRASLAH